MAHKGLKSGLLRAIILYENVRRTQEFNQTKIRLSPFDPNYGDPVPASLRGDLLVPDPLPWIQLLAESKLEWRMNKTVVTHSSRRVFGSGPIMIEQRHPIVPRPRIFIRRVILSWSIPD